MSKWDDTYAEFLDRHELNHTDALAYLYYCVLAEDLQDDECAYVVNIARSHAKLAKKSIRELIEKDTERATSRLGAIAEMEKIREVAMTNRDTSKNLEDRSYYRGQINVCDYFLRGCI